MANNGIFYTSGNTLDFTTTGTTWARLSSGGTFSSLGLSATTYYNLPQSVSGTGTQDYVTKWDNSTSGITNSEIYSTSGLIGLFTSSAFYGGEIVSMSTSNKGITIDGLYLREDGNGSIAMAVGFDYSTWTSGGNEIAIGNGNPLSSSAGQYNIAIGNRSLMSNTVGNNNVSIGGSHTLYSNITGSSNVAIGYNSLYNNTIGNYNVTIGEGTGFVNLGSSNVYLGYAAGYNNDGNNNIFIGYAAGYGDTSSSNKLNIGDTIIGDLSSKSIRVPTISATTYDNLPGSSSSNCFTTFYVTNISGCSPVNILSPLNLTGGINVTGITNFTNTVDFSGGLTATTISATTYQNLPVSGVTNGLGISASANNGVITITNTGVTSVTAGSGLSGSSTTGAINLINTDLGSSQNIFKNIQVGGVTQFSAGSNSDNLNFSGINITITSAATNTLVFSAGTGGSGGVTQIIGTSGIGVSPSTGIGNVTLSYTGSTGGSSLGLVYTTGNNLNFI